MKEGKRERKREERGRRSGKNERRKKKGGIRGEGGRHEGRNEGKRELIGMGKGEMGGRSDVRRKDKGGKEEGRESGWFTKQGSSIMQKGRWTLVCWHFQFFSRVIVHWEGCREGSYLEYHMHAA